VFAGYKKLDWILILCVIVLSILGIIIIGSATHIYETGSSSEFMGQKIWLIIGACLMLAFSLIDYEFICKFYFVIYILNLLLLVSVFVLGRQENNSVARWISLGPVGIQPSEFAKIFIIIFLASLINLKQNKINDLKFLFLVLLSIIIPVGLIIKQPALSASVVILFISFVVLIISGLNYKYILRVFLFALPVIGLAIWEIVSNKKIFITRFLKDYQVKRIIALIKSDPYSESFYQTRQSMFAIGSGKIFGKGLYNGEINRLNYLPESHNDFIFSVIGEEFGFVGCILILFFLFVIIILCIYIANNSNQFVGKLIASGVAAMFMFQTFVNIGVATGILPNTGMPLPFVSYGGSSMLTNMIAIGIVLNISRNSSKNFFYKTNKYLILPEK